MCEIPSIGRNDIDDLVKFIKITVEKTKQKGVVVGLSGGLDSAVIARLAVEALDSDNVFGIFLPSNLTPAIDCESVRRFSDALGIKFRIVDMQPVVNSLEAALTPEKQTLLDRGNMLARCRMTVLYNQAKKNNCLVMGTSNKSEIMTGYFTKYGDGACDIMPLANLYKTQVRELAKMIDIPEEIIVKPPTAGLWIGQTDEEELGITYEDLDRILYGFEMGMSELEIQSLFGVSLGKVKEVRERVDSTAHKRSCAVCPK